jgi:hypothetical protein
MFLFKKKPLGVISFDDNFSSVRVIFSRSFGKKIVSRTRKISLKTILDTRHFECEAYREVSFRSTAQKKLELTFLIITPNGFKKNKNLDIKSPHLILNFCKQILNTQTI